MSMLKSWRPWYIKHNIKLLRAMVLLSSDKLKVVVWEGVILQVAGGAPWQAFQAAVWEGVLQK